MLLHLFVKCYIKCYEIDENIKIYYLRGVVSYRLTVRENTNRPSRDEVVRSFVVDGGVGCFVSVTYEARGFSIECELCDLYITKK